MDIQRFAVAGESRFSRHARGYQLARQRLDYRTRRRELAQGFELLARRDSSSCARGSRQARNRLAASLRNLRLARLASKRYRIARSIDSGLELGADQLEFQAVGNLAGSPSPACGSHVPRWRSYVWVSAQVRGARLVDAGGARQPLKKLAIAGTKAACSRI